MAEAKPVVTPEVVKPPEAPKVYHQVLLDTDPQATEAKLRARGMDLVKYGCCGPNKTAASIPRDQRSLGCPVWEQCTLRQIKGKAGPINLPYRLYKAAGKVREGWGPCFTVFRMGAQYNLGSDNFVMEILPLTSKVEVRGSKEIRNADGTTTWEEFLEEQAIPPFPKLGDRGVHVAEQQKEKVRAAQLAARQRQMIDTTLGIRPEDVPQETE